MTKTQIKKEWQKPANKKSLALLIEKFGKFKYISIIGYDGDLKYYRVSTKKIITEGIKGQDLLNSKYGKKISKKEYEKKTIL